MPDDLKPVLARQMEVYAGFLEHTDHHVGRLIDALEELEVLDDTLVYVHHRRQRRLGRGHARTAPSTSWSSSTAPAALETTEFMASRIDDFGTPKAYNHYAVGWAHAMDTPYQWTKQVASHWGGTRNGTIVHWPNGIKAKGEIRTPVPPRDRRRRRRCSTRPGCPSPRSSTASSRCRCRACRMAYSFDDAAAAERHETQYFEMFCNRGIYHQGWTAVTRHSTPWVMAADARRSTTTCGSSTRPTTGRRRTTSRPSSPRSWPSCSGCS